MTLYSELRRREVLKMVALYVAGSWAVIQAADLFFPGACIPESSIRHVWIAVAVGLPVALIFAWCFDLSRSGVRRTLPADGGSSSRKLVRSDVALLSVLSILAFGIVGLQGNTIVATRNCDPIIVDQGIFDPRPGSIAVLPFVNMSEDPNNEFFSDGVSVQILDLLTQVPELLVIQWPTVSYYRGKGVQFRQIARELNVAHVLVGSVRKAGDQVRVTAQLVDANSEAGVWSATYERRVDDAFAIQDEVADAVVKSILPYFAGDTPRTVATDPDAQELFLQAQHLIRQRNAASFDRAGVLLKKVLAIDPDYAPAWTELAYYYLSPARELPLDFHQAADLGRQAAQQALSLDPNDWKARALLGRISLEYDFDFANAKIEVEKALEGNANDTLVLSIAARVYRCIGQITEAMKFAERAYRRDPASPTHSYQVGLYRYLIGEPAEAIEYLEQVLVLSPNLANVRFDLSMSLLANGDAEAAFATIADERDAGFRLTGDAILEYHAGNIEASDLALQYLIENHSELYAYQIAWVYAERTELDKAFFWLEQAYENRDGGLSEMLLEPLLENLHGDRRWEPFVKKVGFPT